MGQSLRRSSFLQLELLEDRRLLAGNVISGYVYDDLNGNGLRDANEPALVSNQLELRNASGTVVGTAITDSNGYYSFNTDSGIGTGLQSQTNTITFADANTNTIRNQTLNQFNPALGTLQSVEIRVDGRIVSNIKMENLDDDAAVVTGTVSGAVLLNGPGFNLNVNVAGGAAINQTLAGFDGTTDYQGASGVTLGARTVTGSNTQTLTGSALSAFLGTGTVNLSFLAQAGTQASGGGNLQFVSSNLGGGQVTVTYKYLNNTALKAGNYTIVQKNQPAGLLDGRESQNGVVIANSFNTDVINVTLGATDSVNNNFGEYRPASLSGFVYQDANDNGIREATEKVFANSQIKLTGTDDRGNSISLNGVTDAAGKYFFDNLRSGSYSIAQNSQPAGSVAGKLTLGSLGGAKGTARDFSGLAVAVGQAGTDYNFGHGLLPASPVVVPVVSKANLLGKVNTPQTPSPVTPAVPATPVVVPVVSKANLLGTSSTTPKPSSPVTVTPAAPTVVPVVSKANLLGNNTTTHQPPSAVTPTTPTVVPVVSKANLLGKASTTPLPPSAVTPTGPTVVQVVSKANLLGTVKTK